MLLNWYGGKKKDYYIKEKLAGEKKGNHWEKSTRGDRLEVGSVSLFTSSPGKKKKRKPQSELTMGRGNRI